ncbi:MAG TPA: hypothetical protein VGM67_09245 [Gemmatimonadaceae bacterium]|jgi:hypothetical protein
MPSKSTKTPEAQLSAFLAKYTPEMAAEARAVRARLAKRMPTAVQMVYDNYRGVVIGFSPNDRPLDAPLSMFVLPDHVSLCFLHGATLDDPDDVLRGAGNQVRHIKLKSASELSSRPVSKLITAALASAKVPFSKTATPRVEVRAVMAKQLSRRKA